MDCLLNCKPNWETMEKSLKVQIQKKKKKKEKIITASTNTVLTSMHEYIKNKEFNVFNKNTINKTKLINNIVLHVWLKRMVLHTCPPV